MTRRTFKNNIIWDLSGTLLITSTTHLTPQEQKDFSLLLYLWAGKEKPSSLDLLALSLMEHIPFEGKQHTGIVRNPAGQAIPEIVYRFLAGIISSTEASQRATSFLTQWKEAHSSLSLEETNHLKKLLITFFNPSALAHCFVENQPLLTLLQKVSCNPLIRNFVLSNWDNNSFPLIYEKHRQSVFPFFKKNDIVISGYAGSLKPEKTFYNYFLNKYDCPPESFFFIDDQADNIAAAEEVGIEGIQFKPTKIDQLVLKLKELLVLSE